MGSAAEQYRGAETQNETQKEGSERTAGAQQIRSGIAHIAESSLKKKGISEETYQGYRELAKGEEAKGKGKKQMSENELRNVLTFAQEHDQRVATLRSHLEKAVSSKITSQEHMNVLMEKLVAENEMTLKENFGRIEKLILTKIDQMQKDRQQYDKAVNHPLVENGVMKIDDQLTRVIPNEEAFLRMKSPDRRAFLAKFQEDMERADAYLNDRYDELLKEEMGEGGVIGEQSYKKFIGEFTAEDMDTADKVHWIHEFPAQMQRYKTLWKNIRSTLEGEDLEYMESLRDEKGYTELFTEYGAIRAKVMEEAGAEAPEEESVEKEPPANDNADDEDWHAQSKLILGKIESTQKRKGIQEFADQLEEKTESEQLHIFQRFKRIILGSEISEAAESNYDFQDDLKKQRTEVMEQREAKKQKEEIIVSDSTFNAHERVRLARMAANDNAEEREDDEEILTENEIFDDLSEAGVDVIEERGFKQVEQTNENGEIERTAEVKINDKPAFNSFLREDAKYHYAPDTQKDSLNWAVSTGSSETEALDYDDQVVLLDFLEGGRKARQKKVQEMPREEELKRAA